MPWVVRPATVEDEGVCLYLWLKSYARTAPGSAVDRKDLRRYWDNHRHIALSLLRGAGGSYTNVVCDRSDEWVVWGFSCQSPGTVHYANVKSSFSSVRDDIMRDLLGASLTEARFASYLIHGMAMPRNWTLDPYCLPALLENK